MSGKADRGQLLGEGLFETVLMVRGEPLHAAEHAARMASSAAALGLPCPDDVHALLLAGGAPEWESMGRPPRAALRVTLTAGAGRGLVAPGERRARVRFDVTALTDAPDPTPLRAVTVDAHRVDPSAAISGHKTLSWMPWTLARKEALARGADVALVTTIDGDVCEADHANLFAVIDGVVVTPGLDRGVLPGITRGRALAALRAEGRDAIERAIALDELPGASEIWLTSSLDGVRGLVSVDGLNLAAPGPVTSWLADCLSDL